MIEVSVPAEVAPELDEVCNPATEINTGGGLGGFAEVAAYSAVFAAQAATAVTLLQGPNTIRLVAAALARRRHRKESCWLSVKGPGGMANLELVEPLDEFVLAGLLAAVWRID